MSSILREMSTPTTSSYRSASSPQLLPLPQPTSMARAPVDSCVRSHDRTGLVAASRTWVNRSYRSARSSKYGSVVLIRLPGFRAHGSSPVSAEDLHPATETIRGSRTSRKGAYAEPAHSRGLIGSSNLAMGDVMHDRDPQCSGAMSAR